MNFQQEIETCLRARVPFIYVVTHEEMQVIEELRSVCEKRKTALYTWDIADLFHTVTGNGHVPEAREPIEALEQVEAVVEKAVFAFPDFHQCWENQPRVTRKLRNLAHTLKYSHKTLIVTAPSHQLPLELEDDACILEYRPPEAADMRKILEGLLTAPGTMATLSPEDTDRLIRSALGLSSNQAQRAFAKAIVSGGSLSKDDVALIVQEKRQIVRGSGALDVYEPKETPNDVGGLQVLKEWLRLRESAFSEAARRYGLPEPRGIALIGIPGTGKSLTAKMIARLWRIPLLRLDIGALFGRFVGESEENVRRALKLAETMSPCVLWIDEIEKGIATGNADGGTSLRVLATLLSWMQEKDKPVFVVATANDVSKLPPELLRRGRFDEIFFLDLPTKLERTEIFRVHIAKRGRDPKAYDLESLSEASAGYVGAEIEQAVIDAMYRAFNDTEKPQREFTDKDIVHAVSTLIPLSQSQRENIAALRQWLREGRAQSASPPDAPLSS